MLPHVTNGRHGLESVRLQAGDKGGLEPARLDIREGVLPHAQVDPPPLVVERNPRVERKARQRVAN